MSEKEIVKSDTEEEEEDLLFAGEDEDEEITTAAVDPKLKPWQVLIVDDDKEVHSITKLVLGDYVFESRPLEFSSAYSGAEAKKMIEENPDFSLVLLDVVMETDHAGLEVAKYIRRDLNNSFVRIILRTGQPGQAPENKVIVDYDINDYKEKTELTAKKLFTTITATLRSFRDLKIIDKNRMGLKQIVDASASLFELQSLRRFAAGVLTQLTSLFRLEEASIYLQRSGLAAVQTQDTFYVLAATGEYEHSVGKPLEEAVEKDVFVQIMNTLEKKKSDYGEDKYIGYFETDNSANLLYLTGLQKLNEFDRELLEIFEMNVSVAFDNIYLNREIIDTQKEVIYTLGEVLETRSKEAAYHVKRVSEFCRVIAQKAGLPEEECELIMRAAPMHDVGKIGIPDQILNKPGRLTKEEFDVIKLHSKIGYDVLKSSRRHILQTAAKIALLHHERWDGKGYPQGLKGEETHIFGRIAAIADVFDALSHARIYKPAWELERIIEMFKEGKGTQFDPELIELFLHNLDDFLEINAKFSE